MSVFLTPELKPVFGGTYFPPEDSFGRPGFKSVLKSLAKQWAENPDKFVRSGDRILEALKEATTAVKAHWKYFLITVGTHYNGNVGKSTKFRYCEYLSYNESGSFIK